jgi:hypothetical protein
MSCLRLRVCRAQIHTSDKKAIEMSLMTNANHELKSKKPLLRFDGWLLATFLLSLFLAILLVEPLLRINLRVPIDYNEGWNAYFSSRAWGGSLYPVDNAFLINNYPPLSFYCTSAVGKLTGDLIIAGRWLSLASLVATGMLISLIASRVAGSRALGFFAGVLFLCTFCHQDSSYVAMNDPQVFGHALATAGLAFLVLGDRSKMWTVAISAALLLSAGLVKHNLLPLPVAITLWLFFENRRGFWGWIAASGGLLILALGACQLVYGHAFFQSVFGHHRVFRIGLLASNTNGLVVPLAALIAIPIAGFASGDRRPVMWLLLLYVLISTAFGIFTSGGEGVDRNAFFDVIIGGSMATALTLHRAATNLKQPRGRLIEISLAGILILPTALALPSISLRTLYFAREVGEIRKEAEKDVDFLKAHDGPAMCESLAVGFWANKKMEVDYFNVGQAMATGHLDSGVLTTRIQREEFSVIQLDTEGGTFRLPKEINEAIAAHYVVIRRSRSAGVFLCPVHATTQAKEERR